MSSFRIYLNNFSLTNKSNYFLDKFNKENYNCITNGNTNYNNRLINEYKFYEKYNNRHNSNYKYRIPFYSPNQRKVPRNFNINKIDNSDNRYCLCKSKLYKNKNSPFLLTQNLSYLLIIL